MKELDRKELMNLFEEFLNDHSSYWTFKDYIEEKGYTMEELGFEPDI